MTESTAKDASPKGSSVHDRVQQLVNGVSDEASKEYRSPPEQSQRHIIDELVRMGLQESAIERALDSGDVSGVIQLVQQSALSKNMKLKAERRITTLHALAHN